MNASDSNNFMLPFFEHCKLHQSMRYLITHNPQWHISFPLTEETFRFQDENDYEYKNSQIKDKESFIALLFHPKN